MRRTKIVATLGPATDSVKSLSEMIRAGVDVVRLNLSHGPWPVHQTRIRMARQAATEVGVEIGIMLDTRGPEVRLGSLKSPLHLTPGDRIEIGQQGPDSLPNLTVSWGGLFETVKPGESLWIDDGRIVVEVESVEADRMTLIARNGGTVQSHKKLSRPESGWPLDPLTDFDEECLIRGIQEEAIDFVALSFVRTIDDVFWVRRFLEQHDLETFLIAKIENRMGMDNLEEILRVSDGVMVARGDLGVELPEEEVPELQKTIIEAANASGKPVITATQMLESMVEHDRPTRAEVTDVANAIWDGSDAVMLSAETAIGNYPVATVAMMARIAERAEQSSTFRRRREFQRERVADVVSHAAAEIAEELRARAILTPTESGYTARMVSRSRPKTPILALSSHIKSLRQLTVFWGVLGIRMERIEESDDMVKEAIATTIQNGLLDQGDLVVVTAGTPYGTPGTTNLVRVETIAEPILHGQGVGADLAAVTGPIVYLPLVGVPPRHFVAVVEGYRPEWVAMLDNAIAIVSTDLGLSSDLAVFATTRHIPAVVGLQGIGEALPEGHYVTVDPVRGIVYRGRVKV